MSAHMFQQDCSAKHAMHALFFNTFSPFFIRHAGQCMHTACIIFLNMHCFSQHWFFLFETKSANAKPRKPSRLGVVTVDMHGDAGDMYSNTHLVKACSTKQIFRQYNMRHVVHIKARWTAVRRQMWYSANFWMRNAKDLWRIDHMTHFEAVPLMLSTWLSQDSTRAVRTRFEW